jgi:hypothetical protein
VSAGASTAALSVVIPNYQRPALLRRCLQSVLAARAASASQIEVIVVDDGSGDESCSIVRDEFPSVALVALAANRGYPVAVNAGVDASNSEWVLTLNNDTTVDEALFDQLLAVARSGPDIGLVAAQQRFSADHSVLYSAGTVVDARGHASDRLMGAPVGASEREPVEVFGACGAAALYRRSLLSELGGFDERFAFGLEDVDLAWRARMRGWRCLYAPGAIVYHDLGGTIPHGSALRMYQAGRNRWLLIAKNLDTRQLLAGLPRIVAFDLAYVAYACARFRTLAPVRGRFAGFRLWRTARAAGAPGRTAVTLSPAQPLRAALGRRRAWVYAQAEPRTAATPDWLEKPRHVLVLNQYVVPDTASTGRFAFEVAAAIARDGARVTFLAGQPSYATAQPTAAARELRDGVEIRRLRIFGGGGRRTRPRRFAGYLAYLLRAAATSARLIARGRVDTIVCFHNPPLLALLGAALARGRRRLVCIMLDIHPDVLVATGWLAPGSPAISLWNRLNGLAFGAATNVVVISEDMRAVLLEKGVDPGKLEVIPIWAEPELAPAPADPQLRAQLGVADDELLLLFTGNMGITQQLEPVAEAAALLADSPVRFCLAGAGVHAQRWRRVAGGLPNVTFLPYQGEEEYRTLVAACDVGLVTLAPRIERLVVPSRAFPLLSAGVPLLCVMGAETELGRLVTRHGCGVCSVHPEELAAAVGTWIRDRAKLRAAGRNARAAYLAEHSRAEALQRYAALCRDPARREGVTGEESPRVRQEQI